MTKLEVVTFGCRLNAFESEVIREKLGSNIEENTVVFNTCAVTKEAERQAKQAIRKFIRENPDYKVVVTGCAAQIAPQKYSDIEGVDLVLGNEEKLDKANYLNTETEKVLVNDIMSVKETASHLIKSFDGKTRGFIQVQNGCDHRCTFCIIPYGRGNSRSIPMGEIVHQVKHLVEQGFKEIVLTGVDITSYGKDLPGNPNLGQMMKRLLKLVPDLPRLRLSSVDVAEIDDDIMDMLANEPRFMPHLHISLQAGDNMILKRMKRRHTREDVIEFCKKAKQLNNKVIFGADIIAGFPTETDEMFENTSKLIVEAQISHLHSFPYSEREGTPAAKMPQVEKQVRKRRAEVLRELAKLELEKRLKEFVGMEMSVLVEADGTGKTENFLPVILQESYTSGTLLNVVITGIQDGFLVSKSI
ncbi:MAG: tRNA (N(6)-L-threonylcarbamoyladenosine(37)-C(2))-methylthiotransferase MtaB [Alphaproteobacteria bacterium]|nr:tRNA (N(6)-L-threonylcarbamoyladenosine(37)-C(2))-methylthiotransferase MtaB [Alphaproteobacteria bacterium]OJV14231.1 MAG: tRNA (N(6)-L-threonylcarbamoyladenosine(37)-C(2))-methylthiotransferase MtaB [Alphaproteobacteria bacterium 33-17]